MIDRDHPLVGTAVVYRSHPGADPEQGVVTAVNSTAGAVFVRYGLGCTSMNTPVDRLTTLGGEGLDLTHPGHTLVR